MENKIKVFENKQVRTSWNAEEEEWYFSVVDIVAVLTDSVNPTDYLKKMRKRDPELNAYIGTNCPQVEMRGESGKKRKVLAASTKGVLRIVRASYRAVHSVAQSRTVQDVAGAGGERAPG